MDAFSSLFPEFHSPTLNQDIKELNLRASLPNSELTLPVFAFSECSAQSPDAWVWTPASEEEAAGAAEEFGLEVEQLKAAPCKGEEVLEWLKKNEVSLNDVVSSL